MIDDLVIINADDATGFITFSPKESSRGKCNIFKQSLQFKIVAGIGRDLALRLSKFGGTVIALSKTKEYLDTLTKQDSKIQTLCVNLRDWDATRKAIKSVLPIDLLVNNAGVACLRPFLQATREDFDLTFDVNVKQILNVSQIVAENMIERKVAGSIVNISSQASHAALKDHAVYCASKGAVDMLTK